jgi:hypothetical protein
MTKGRLFFDTEDNSKGRFLLGVVYDTARKEYITFKDAGDLRTYILEHGREVWAHNVQYDIGNIFGDRLTDLEYKITRGVFVKAVYRKSGHYVRFYDTMKLLPLSLRNIGNAMGVKKGIMGRGNMEKYCRRDVEILKGIVEGMEKSFSEKFGIKLAYTLGGNAMRIFRTMYKGNLSLPKQFDEYIRRSYYGGRVELFRVGKVRGDIFEADVNSMYPSVMKDISFPDWNRLKFTESRKSFVDREGFTFCRVRSPLAIPVLPFKTESGELTFPSGTFSGVWTNKELRVLIRDGGAVERIYWSIYSKKSVPSIFRDYVDTLYQLKRTDDNQYRVLLWKLLLNSLYGKFGFRGDVENIVPLDADKGTDGIIVFGKERPFCMEERKVTSKYQNVAIASYITASARLRLYEGLKRAGKSAVYCDTDSIFTTEDIWPKTDKLGEFSAKGKYNGGEFLLPKLYQVGKKVRAKGMRIPNRMAWNDFRRKGYSVTVRPTKIKTAIREGIPVNIWKKEKKRIASRYTKRLTRPDGTTTPIIR